MVNMTEQEKLTFLKSFLSAGVNIMFDTTYYCDLGCPHCHYDCTTKSRTFMPESDVYAILDELKKYPSNILDLHFSGGEISTIEEVNPGYVKRILSKSVNYGFYTTMMTNGSFIENEKTYGNRLTNDLAELYKSADDKFHVQMSFDQYHKNSVPNAHKLIGALDTRLQNDHGIKYDFSLTGFKHDPEFANNFIMNPRYINVSNRLSWDLNPIGRAKTNDLPYVRDTKNEFEQFCSEDKLKQLIFTPLYPIDIDGKIFYSIQLVFNCNGYVVLSDAHNPENIDTFKIPYRKPDGTMRTLMDIRASLAAVLAHHFYGETKDK